MPILMLLTSLAFTPSSHATRAHPCVQALVRGLYVIESAAGARRRLDRAAESAKFAPLDAREFELARKIERQIRPHFFIPGEVLERLFKDYNGPRDQFIKRLESTSEWLTALKSGRIAPEGSALHPFTEMLWGIRAAMGAEVHEVSWTNFDGHTGLMDSPHLIPTGTLADESWPGKLPLEDVIAERKLPIESFIGVIYPWPAVVIGRIVEHHLLDQQLDQLEASGAEADEFEATLFAINHHMLEAMLTEYQSLIVDHPEFRSKHFDDIVAQGSFEGVRHCLRRDYRHPDPKYVDVVKPPAKND